MAIVSLPVVEAYSGIEFTGADATSVNTLCAAVERAVKRLVYPFEPEPATVTQQILDAPLDNVLLLPRTPVRAITALWMHLGAGGDPGAFDAVTDLLTPYTDYYMPADDGPNAWARYGKVYRRGASTWGFESRRPLGKLGATEEPNRGAVMVTYTCGASAVPPDIEAACVTAVVLLYGRRKTGFPVQSESWNGYSFSAAGPFTAEAAVRSPEVIALLAPYLTVAVGGY